MKTMDLYHHFNKKKRRMQLSGIAQRNQHISSEDEDKILSTTTMYQLTTSGTPVFDILQPGHKEETYNNPLMDCFSMGECEFILCITKTIHFTFKDLDVFSAHDRLRDEKRLRTVRFQIGDDCWSLDLGFPSDDDDGMVNELDLGFPSSHDGWLTDNHNQPQLDMLDMQFPTMPDDNQSNGEMLELGFPPELDVKDVLDLGFNITISDPVGNIDGALDMGFDTNLVDDALDISLEMGFDMDPVHIDLDHSCKPSCFTKY